MEYFSCVTGEVESMADKFCTSVSLGRAHIVVLTKCGQVWTAGSNFKGQLGRDTNQFQC